MTPSMAVGWWRAQGKPIQGTSGPRGRFAPIGGSGTWAFPYPDGALDGHPHLAVEVVEADIQVATPFGPSPSFRLCRLADRRTGEAHDYLYVWMHGIDPANPVDPPHRTR